ncbi:unnamed protein product [Phytophthora fragariaefolia]|uniref:Unnamed protein product n=1 Tax=Phytophthora fragariaefolia TaxID=1490495 RepID=A0A9W6Y4S2_9STRA|nr:unnamed protein product [Phytophthora fragariaefolia]
MAETEIPCLEEDEVSSSETSASSEEVQAQPFRAPTLEKTRAYRQRLYTGQSPTIVDFSPQDYTGLEFVASDLDNLIITQVTSVAASDTGKSPLELVQVEQPRANSTTGAGTTSICGTSQEQVPDDGYRLQRNQKKDRAPKASMPTAELGAESGASAEGSSRQQADGRTSSRSKPDTQARGGLLVSAEVPNDTSKQQPASRGKQGNTMRNPAKPFARFAQLAASERYRQTREAYALLEGDDEDFSMDEVPVESTDIDQNVSTSIEEDTDDQRTSYSPDSIGNHSQRGTAQVEYEPLSSDDCDGTSATSDDETVSVLRERKRVEQALAESYGQWLAAGNGHEIAVEISGQSMYSAYYVTTGDLPCKRWRPDDDDLHEVNHVKERVLNVLLANLRYDIHLELVDPVKVVAIRYPNVKRPTSSAAAACVRMEEGEVGILGVDQYTRHVYKMPNGDKHETGIVVTMSLEMVTTLIQECSAAHVVPIMLLYDESTCHYAGTSYGQLYAEWDNQLGSTMRQRLDGVHRKLHFEVLDGSPLDYETLALEATEEEESILDELGLDVYASGARNQQVADASSNMLLKRAPVPRATQVHEEVYSRILQEDSSQKLSAIDARVAEKLHRSNGQAFKKWMTKQGSKMGLLKNAAKYEDTDTWPCEQSKAMRSLFGFLPFPELAAQKLPTDRLIGWGEHEAFNHLKRVLERTRDDPEQADEARDLITTWIAECQSANKLTALSMIQDTAKWTELRNYADESLIHTCRDDIPLNHWYIVYVLPYVVRRWSTSVMARIPASSRSIWYTSFPEVKKLCQDIVCRRDWSGIVNVAENATVQGFTSSPSTSAVDANDITTGFLTQNVRGLGRTDRDRQEWIASFRRKTTNGILDVVLVQETHVTEQEIPHMSSLHARQWGYRTGTGLMELSFWSPCDGRSAGVAILIHPKSRLLNPKPIWQHSWNDRFMAISGTLQGEEVIICKCSAPIAAVKREAFFSQVLEVDIPEDFKIFVGGGFNCTLHHRVDRSYLTLEYIHDSPTLRRLLAAWRLTDSLSNQIPDIHDAKALLDFFNEHHTYHYSVDGVGLATSRLDRWYVSDSGRLWVKGTALEPAGIPTADHQGVLLHVQAPENACKVWKQPKVFPPPPYAARDVRERVEKAIQELQDCIESEVPTAEQAAIMWDKFKAELVLDILRTRRSAQRRLTNTYRQNLLRLQRQEVRVLARARIEAEASSGGDAHLQLQRITTAIAECRRERARYHQQRLYRDHTWRPGQTTKQFFKRISCKFADNLVPTLRPAEGCPTRDAHDKANTFADAWAPIFQGVAPTMEDIMEVAAWMDPVAGDEYTKALADSNFITEEASFVEANIFCLKKQGDSSNPLNYRPLSLLNTDYKILTGMVSDKVGPTLSSRIHPNQNGFVAGRQIHDTLDLYTVAKQVANSIPELERAIAVLLDFAKAYDSLFREFLYAVLERHGYPERFIRVIRALHTDTIVRFLINGQISRAVEVLRGIRQGCPLAPELFILALEPLYQMLEKTSTLVGINLKSLSDTNELRVGGSDDTASYLKSPEYMPALLQITSKFRTASGLLINASKTVVIVLNDCVSSDLPSLPTGFCYHDPRITARYLGLQVGGHLSPEVTW